MSRVKNRPKFASFVPTLVVMDGFTLPEYTTTEFAMVLISGLIGIAIADTWYLRSLDLMGASRTGIVASLLSPFVILLSAIFLGERPNCSSCGARGSLEPRKLSNEGTLYVYSIVHRSFPGIEVPYVSAIVDLEGGGTVKGNLINIDPDPAKIEMGMRVEVVYDKAPIQDKEGNNYMIYAFQPASS